MLKVEIKTSDKYLGLQYHTVDITEEDLKKLAVKKIKKERNVFHNTEFELSEIKVYAKL